MNLIDNWEARPGLLLKDILEFKKAMDTNKGPDVLPDNSSLTSTILVPDNVLKITPRALNRRESFTV